MAAHDVALENGQARVASISAARTGTGVPLGAAAHWSAIAGAHQGVATRGGFLDLIGARAMEPEYRALGVLYGLIDGAAFTAMADELAAWIAVEGAPTLPTPPLNPRITVGDGQLDVVWDPPASDGSAAIISYKVTNITTGGVSVVAAPTTHKLYTLLTNGTSYSFKVVATNSKGDSVASATVTANPAGVARRYDFGPGADAPAATWLPAAAGTTSLGTFTDTTNTSFPIEFRSGIYGLDPGAGFGIQLPCETGDWLVDIGGAEWTFNTIGQRVTDIAFVTDAGTVNVARDFDPFAAYGYATPYTKQFVIRVPPGGHGARLIMPERLAKDHAFVTAITVTSIPVGSRTLSPDLPIPGGGGGGGGGVGLVPLGDSSGFKSKAFVNTHWTYINVAFYSNTTTMTSLALSTFGGHVRDGCPGKITNGDQFIGTRFWQWVVANNLKIIYISPSTAFANFSSHVVNRQVMESVPGAAACIVGVEPPNERDFAYAGNPAGFQAEITTFCNAWAGYTLFAPSMGSWPTAAGYNVFANDPRFAYGNDHSYMGVDWSPSDNQMAQAISLQSIIVGNRPHACTEAGHGTYSGGIGPDGTTGPNTGNPPLTEAQQADSYLREQLDRDRFGYTFFTLYELGDETTVNNYETRLGCYHTDYTDKPSGAALRFLRSFYSSDPGTITNCPVTITGADANTRYNLRQRNGAWLLACWQQGNTPAPAALTFTFPSNRSCASWNLRTTAAIASSATTTSFAVSSTGTPTMVVIS